MTFTTRRRRGASASHDHAPRSGVRRGRHKGRRLRDEASNSFALFIVMAPVIFAAFGIGLDFSRNVFIRTELQNALDLAVVGGAAVAEVNNEGQVVVDRTEARTAIKRVYALNRQNAATMDCWGTRAFIEGTTLQECWRAGDEEWNGDEVVFSVRERSQNAFLTVVGVKWQRYEIVSRAVLRQQAE